MPRRRHSVAGDRGPHLHAGRDLLDGLPIVRPDDTMIGQMVVQRAACGWIAPAGDRQGAIGHDVTDVISPRPFVDEGSRSVRATDVEAPVRDDQAQRSNQDAHSVLQGREHPCASGTLVVQAMSGRGLTR